MGDFYKEQSYKTDIGYYIHRTSRHIGMLQTLIPEMDLASVFAQEKQKAGLAVKNQFKSLYKNTIKGLTEESKILLNECFETGSDEILTNIDTALRETLQQGIDEDAITKMLHLERKLNNIKLQNGLDKILADTEDNLKKIDEMIDILIKAIKQLKAGKSGAILISVLTTFLQNRGSSLTEYGTNLRAALEEYKNRTDTHNSINKKQINAVVDQINSLAKNLAKGKTSKGDNLTANGIMTTFQNNIFSTGIGEASGLMINKVATDTATMEISKKVAHMQLIGQDTTRIAMTDAQGNYIPGEYEGEKVYGKADLRYRHIELSLLGETEGIEGKFQISVGVSNKFYKNNLFNLTTGFGGKEFSGGGGVNLGRAINISFDNLRLKYLAYNTLAWNEDDVNAKKGMIALQDVLATRNIVYAFSARGKNNDKGQEGDFSSFMLVNGKFVSIWEMIQYAITTNIGLSHSASQNTDQAINLSFGEIEDRKSMSAHLNESYRDRIKNTNDAINKIKLTFHIRPTLLAKAMRGSLI